MTLAESLWYQVRQRADAACEYCGVKEIDCGGLLTVDHFQPQACGGSEDFSNLVYCCWRCNLYKADFWKTPPDDRTLWNPRTEAAAAHFVQLADATLHGLTPTGLFTVERLRLNRPALVAYRRRQLMQAAELRLLAQHREAIASLEHLQRQHALLLDEQRALLAEQRALLRLLLSRLS